MLSRKDLYDFHIVTPHEDITVRLGTPGAKDWGSRYAEVLDRATMIQLVPRENAKGMPEVSVILAGEKKWLYYMRTQGVMMGGNTPLKKEFTTYNIGWTLGERSEVIAVYPDGKIIMQTGITLDRSKKNGSNGRDSLLVGEPAI